MARALCSGVGDGAMMWENHGRYAMRVEEVDAPCRLVGSRVHEPGVVFEDTPATRVERDLTELVECVQ